MPWELKLVSWHACVGRALWSVTVDVNTVLYGNSVIVKLT